MPYTPRPPEKVIVTDFDDSRNRFSTYWPALRDAPIPTPETYITPLDGNEKEPENTTWDTEGIQNWLSENGISRAFVRTGHKSATRDFRAGSIITGQSPNSIDETITSLLNQHILDGWPTGGEVVVREWIDFDFCLGGQKHVCHPEIRFFIQNGAVRAETPLYAPGEGHRFVCANSYDYLTSVLDSYNPADARKYAEIAAEALSQTPYAVDVAMDTSGKWWVTEVNLDGVRDTHDGYRNMTGHGPLYPYSPAVHLSRQE